MRWPVYGVMVTVGLIVLVLWVSVLFSNTSWQFLHAWLVVT